MTALILGELRRRVRGRRWWVLLVLWSAVLFALVYVVRVGVRNSARFTIDPPEAGPVMFGSLALFVLAFAALILPSLTATTINGERDRGTLAILQASLLHPWEIVMAKFIAALVTAAAFLVATLPIALWSFIEGGVDLGRAVAVYVILFVMSAVLIALALGASALVRKVTLSAVVAYGSVFVLSVGTLILFGLSFLISPPRAVDTSSRWVIMSHNPFVVLADAAPRSEEGTDDPLSAIREAVRYSRAPARAFGGVEPGPDELGAVWPTGLVIDLAIAAGALYLSVTRLEVPARRLGPGQRVA